LLFILSYDKNKENKNQEWMMRLIAKLIFMVILIASIYFGMKVTVHKVPEPGTTLTNMPESAPHVNANPSHDFAHNSMPPMPSHPQGAQVIHSLLGLEVKFLNGHINYPGGSLVSDPRYMALANTQKLVDSIKFQPTTGSAFLILIAIAKGPKGAPLIVPGRFDVVLKTTQEGFVLRDSHGRFFYYSGYVMQTPAWRNMTPNQILQDGFCKEPVPLERCSANARVNVLLKKSVEPQKDIPLLTMVK
jgi:hypothetical protein